MQLPGQRSKFNDMSSLVFVNIRVVFNFDLKNMLRWNVKGNIPYADSPTDIHGPTDDDELFVANLPYAELPTDDDKLFGWFIGDFLLLLEERQGFLAIIDDLRPEDKVFWRFSAFPTGRASFEVIFFLRFGARKSDCARENILLD
ncbi:uncharacterized protein LOC125501658 [Athalia rosae]|uniref:uncharacterized protein LOC125500909 n=1 Tax=Athalia rosae TaxID=37344 RepID=UPI002034A41F|nr:uncharacterized protein LOC125500909 [Athalia rosae]XP_048513921.1 uncharacterized protein LOC125501658 [Athalia rosae]